MKLLLLALQFVLPFSTAQAGDVAITQVQNPCEQNEAFEFAPSVSQAWRDRFTTTSTEPENSFLILASAQSLRTLAKDPAVQALAEYQVGRVLYRLGLPHLAFERFNAILSFSSPQSRGLKLAALLCLTRLGSQAPDLVLPNQAVQALLSSPLVFSSEEEKNPLWSLVVASMDRQRPATSAPSPDGTIGLLRGSRAYEAYVLAMQSARADNVSDTVEKLEKFLSYDREGEGIPNPLKDRADAMRLLLGQLYYEEGRYSDAARSFRSVSNESNYLAQALTDLAWANLLSKQYDAS